MFFFLLKSKIKERLCYGGEFVKPIIQNLWFIWLEKSDGPNNRTYKLNSDTETCGSNFKSTELRT